jgi:EAL domain-containing protein (putative c-di-GMP-specific phosphodiesterase class I)
MVDIARTFNMETVAEWVGDETTVRLLTEAGVDYLQGYHFGAPIPPEELPGARAT